MIEIVLVVVIACLLSYIGWGDYQGRKEREKLMKIIISKNAQELRDLEFVEKVKVNMPEKANPIELQQDPDLISAEQMSDEEFNKFIKDQHGG